MKHTGTRQSNKRKHGIGMWGVWLRGGAIGLLAAMLCLMIGCVLITSGVLAEEGVDAGVLVCCAAGAMIGSWTSIRSGEKHGMSWGIYYGSSLALMLLVSGYLLYNDLDAPWCIAVGTACVSGGVAASALMGARGVRRGR